ncbi:MAG: hypothetical protein HY763_01840 [Planctomycetes bacterium]|nr:hypothetical protein [Planctomycetota bacterium]
MAATHRPNRCSLLWRPAVLATACLVLGTACHELIGHGLTGLLAGGRIQWVDVLGVRVYPSPAWVGAEGFFGQCEVTGLEGARTEALVALAGSMSTWVAAAVATVLLAVRRWPHRVQLALLALSVWWVDLLTYTLPSFGLRRFVVLGRYVREPFDAAVALGIPGPVFQAFVIVSCLLLAAASGWFSFRFLRTFRDAERERLPHL